MRENLRKMRVDSEHNQMLSPTPRIKIAATPIDSPDLQRSRTSTIDFGQHKNKDKDRVVTPKHKMDEFFRRQKEKKLNKLISDPPYEVVPLDSINRRATDYHAKSGAG